MFGSFASVKDKEKAWRVYMWEIRVPFAVNMVLAAAVLAAVQLPRKVAVKFFQALNTMSFLPRLE